MNPITNRIGTIFIPVNNIEKSRDWYCDLLGVPVDGEVLFGHLYILPFDGTGIVLDSKIYSRGAAVFKWPAFHFNTNDIEKAYTFIKEKNINLLCEIQHDRWFNFEDPDGNALMICLC